MKNARWVRLADDLTRGITNGDYPLDSYLPTEMELCEKYNVSRYTVRLALADLTRMGLIKRWPRLGSKVVSVGFDETYAHTYTSFADIDGLSSTHKRVVQGTQECVVDHALAKRLECERYLRFLRFSNVRTNPTDNGKPVVWTAVYVNAAYSRLPDLARLNPLVLLSTLIEKYGDHRDLHSFPTRRSSDLSRRFPPFPFLQKPQCIWMLRSAHLASVFSATTWVLSGTSSKFQSLIIPATVTH